MAGLLCLLCACATVHPDHYYILSSQPQGPLETRTAPASQVTLRVSLPSLVDRPEMVLNTSADAVTVLEHERWAAPLADLVAQTLAQDIERRRADLLVTSLSHPGQARLKVSVDIVQVSVRRGGQASIDAHWRILDARTAGEAVGSEAVGGEAVGGDVFNAPLADDSYGAIARALSDCLAALAERLVSQLPRTERTQ
jgi:uncharacterized lipoprotein YmbA